MKKVIISVFLLASLNSFAQNSTISELWKYYLANDYNQVIEKANRLLDTEPNKIELNLVLGRSYTNKGEFKKAIPFLIYTINKDTTNSWQKAWAYAEIGRCYFMEQKYEESKKAIAGCLSTNATKKATKYAYGQSLLYGFDKFYDNWKIVETDHFRFHFQNTNNTDIEKFVSLKEEAYKRINNFFKSTLPKKIDFFVWESGEDARNLLKTNLGFAKPEFCIIHSLYQQTIGHEMTHVISNFTSVLLTKTRFINEGTAVCFDQTNRDNMRLVKEWNKTNNSKISIKECWISGESYPDDLLYPLSGLFVNKIIEKFGKEKFLEFFKNQTYENASTVFGNKLDKLIKDLESEINN